MNSNYKVHPTFTKYLIGKNGDVINKKTGRKRKLTTLKEGYLIVSLRKDKKDHVRSVHRLVLQTYNPIENDHLYHAHHENEVRDDNRLENLEWVLIEDHIREHHTGQVRSEETRRKISESLKGHLVGEETRKKIGKVHKGRVHSKEARRKMSESGKGRVITEEHRRKISESLKGEFYWNNGTRTIRSKECPGEGWMRGKITEIKG
jgi:hypothetical protein